PPAGDARGATRRGGRARARGSHPHAEQRDVRAPGALRVPERPRRARRSDGAAAGGADSGATLVAAATPVSPRGDPSREAGVGGPAERGEPRCWPMAAEGLDTDEGRRDGLGRECALRERVLDAAHRGARGAERLTDEQHVAAGLQRGDGGAAGGGAAGHGVHLEIVAEEDAAKTEAVAEEV